MSEHRLAFYSSRGVGQPPRIYRVLLEVELHIRRLNLDVVVFYLHISIIIYLVVPEVLNGAVITTSVYLRFNGGFLLLVGNQRVLTCKQGVGRDFLPSDAVCHRHEHSAVYNILPPDCQRRRCQTEEKN